MCTQLLRVTHRPRSDTIVSSFPPNSDTFEINFFLVFVIFDMGSGGSKKKKLGAVGTAKAGKVTNMFFIIVIIYLFSPTHSPKSFLTLNCEI